MAEKLKLVPPRLLLMTGVGGSGKTSLIESLLEVVDADYVSKDIIGDTVTRSRGVEYIENARKGVYEQVLQETARSVILGRSVMVDASFRFEIRQSGWEAPYRELADQNGVVLQIIRLVLSPETLRERIEKRGSPYDTHKLVSEEAWRSWLAEEPIHEPMPSGTLFIKNNDGRNSAVQQVLSFIGIHPQELVQNVGDIFRNSPIV